MVAQKTLGAFFKKNAPDATSGRALSQSTKVAGAVAVGSTACDTLRSSKRTASDAGLSSPPDDAAEILRQKRQIALAKKDRASLLRLEKTELPSAWLTLLQPAINRRSFLDLKKFLRDEWGKGTIVYPEKQNIYSWAKFCPDPTQVKVVVIGQDPYHGPGQAHGLSFSVPRGVAIPKSLVNIYKELNHDPKVPNFQTPKHGNLESWAKQGVMMLNATLTVRKATPMSHANKGWEDFTDYVVECLNKGPEPIVWLLWGAHAQKKGANIDRTRHRVLTSAHPSPLSAHRGFFGCGHFGMVNEQLAKWGRPTIEWEAL
eukprot:Clim_evm114s147 gene=Clim_evmTU114s147